MTTAMKVEEYPRLDRWFNWIAQNSIKNRMKGRDKSYTNLIDVYLHFMLVVEVIKLNRILYLLMSVRWHLMLHIVMSNWFMDWQKYPKRKM